MFSSGSADTVQYFPSYSGLFCLILMPPRRTSLSCCILLGWNSLGPLECHRSAPAGSACALSVSPGSMFAGRWVHLCFLH